MPHVLRQRRERLGMTQEAIGEKLGWSSAQSHVSAIERDQQAPAHRVAAISDFLAAEEQARGLEPLRLPRNHHLAERRKKLGLTQHQLAELAGFPVGDHGAYFIGRAENGDETQVHAIRRTLVWLESAKRRAREERRCEERRIEFQRSLWAELPDHPAIRALKTAMLDRCLDLMHQGRGEETDAIAEFLPGDDVQAMFDQWERESNPQTEPATIEAAEPAAP